ncbi:hypothetical protein [Acerihabitans arboris]|uniref:Uncharacterized protein n=1 Tax=Acerihabitans arboris TaxID=2691583 RepID=A0A845SIW2_9GAMM|nr:hypothetical protein [Acerihabitans arboris]
MHESGKISFIFIWIIYFYGNKAYTQNKILFLDEHPHFSLKISINLLDQDLLIAKMEAKYLNGQLIY